MRLLICAGGTGGGVYPALAVHSALTSQHPHLETLWVGGEGGMEEELVNRAGISYRSIPAAGVHGVGLRALPGNIAKLTRGVLASRRIVHEFKPDVLFFTGGFVAAPMAVAGRNIPTVLYVPDIEPGLALKFLSRFADVVTVTAPDSNKYFPHPERIVLSGYPLRSDLSNWSREQATQHFGLDSCKAHPARHRRKQRRALDQHGCAETSRSIIRCGADHSHHRHFGLAGCRKSGAGITRRIKVSLSCTAVFA
ncbi:MAG: UDP-N-acetylglucosamine--N-acetylmuramyl-(pentapeptide) pyrophosphoryl-undecaprenol N-acetylglucosamine transferase [Anaerolineales bacterium]|uniref:UDP-N-acetylglucosamine--N-acetylmuramyl- (pentapeptide) pyrophosphoryl-undecaprenol N-acetylglucosamine transferase n=1 Tax=Candidatus Villigracilis proximus TaxID=3140683 RepID=UPI00313563BC|nr:UDP-N-acetylglucosamine--N-acetylmuramyl-(pentapeptide) pyrophosphoryl-undecaprenol N-acetylglucosamine transferase [Anaerolineales bacterium]